MGTNQNSVFFTLKENSSVTGSISWISPIGHCGYGGERDKEITAALANNWGTPPPVGGAVGNITESIESRDTLLAFSRLDGHSERVIGAAPSREAPDRGWHI